MFPGQGAKACPKADLNLLCIPHCAASRDQLQDRLRKDAELAASLSSTPVLRVLECTRARMVGYRRLGCRAPRFEQTFHSDEEERAWRNEQEEAFKSRRGHARGDDICDGRLLFEYSSSGKAIVRCVLATAYR